MTGSLQESLRQRHRNTFGKAFPLVGYDELGAILDEVDRLRVIEDAASELVDQPFGQLNERSFYRLREALDGC